MPQLTFLPWLRVEVQEQFGVLTLVPKELGLGELKGHDRAYADAMCAAYVELHADKDGKHLPVTLTFVRYKNEPLTAEITNEHFNEVVEQLRVLGALAQTPTQ